MRNQSGKDYFSKFLFRSGLECPTKLYYHRRNYPEREEHLPFVEHYRFNKNQIKKLKCYGFKNAVTIQADSIKEAARETEKYVRKEQVTLLDPVFIHDRMMANAAFISKEGEVVTVYQILTKAYDPSRHSLTDADGQIHSKWRNHIIDLAFRVYVIGLCHPEWKINTKIVLPNKRGTADSNLLPHLLMNPDSGNLAEEPNQLLVELEADDEVRKVLSGTGFDDDHYSEETFSETLQRLVRLYYEEDKYPVELGEKCRFCEFKLEAGRQPSDGPCGFNECWSEKHGSDYDKNKKPPVFDLIGPGIRNWLQRDIYLQENVPEEEVYNIDSIINGRGRINERHRQSLQVLQSKGKKVPTEIVKTGLYDELDRWEYPLHFLDFEAGNYAIPLRKSEKPYHLVLFQYSCHTLHKDGTVNHHQWLDRGEYDAPYPNFELVRNLKEIPHIEEGTIIQYSNFERHALKTTRRELQNNHEDLETGEELSRWILSIISRHDSSHHSGPYLSDLSRLVKDFYYNCYMQDSLSIKDVLQTILTVSPRLRELYSEPYNSQNFDSIIWWKKDKDGVPINPYRLLADEYQERSVRRGTEAMVAYASLMQPGLAKQEKETCRESLLRYCELDTLAMLMIYQHWRYLMDMRSSGT